MLEVSDQAGAADANSMAMCHVLWNTVWLALGLVTASDATEAAAAAHVIPPSRFAAGSFQFSFEFAFTRLVS